VVLWLMVAMRLTIGRCAGWGAGNINELAGNPLKSKAARGRQGMNGGRKRGGKNMNERAGNGQVA
jgi:hypothetical protein